MDSTRRPAGGPLLERELELAALDRVIAAVADGRGGVAVVEGEAGLGKSRLLREALARASDAGVDTRRARGSELERDFSFGAALQLLAPLVMAAGERERSELFRGAAAHAEPLFVSGPSAVGDASAERTFPLYHGLHWLLVSLAERSPLLLAVDDVHWADSQTRGFLAYLAQRVDELPLGLVITVRTGEPAAEDEQLQRLRETPGAERIQPAPLSAAACEELVRHSLPDADERFCAACCDASGGNPFFLRELMASVESESIPPTSASASQVLALTPAAVSRSVLARVGRLPQPARDLARAASVLGEVSLDEVSELAGLDRAAAADAAEALQRAEVLAEVDPIGFNHPIVRASIYADLPASTRSSIHADAARFAAAHGFEPEATAAHLLSVDPGDGAWAIDALATAASAARRRGAPAAAVRYLRRALEERPADEVRCRLLAELGHAEADAGDEGGLDHLRASSGLAGRPERRAAALRDLAALLTHRGRYAEAADAAREGLAALAEAEDPDGVLATDLEAIELIAMHWGVVVAEREDSWQRVERLLSNPELELTPAGRALLGHAAIGEGYAGRRRMRVVELARRSLSAHEPTEHPLDPMASALASFALVVAGELEEAERATTEAIEIGRRRGSIIEVAPSAHVRSIARYRLGRLAGAATDAEDAVEAGRHGWGATLPMAHAYLALIWLERGEHEAGLRALDLPGGDAPWRVNPSWGEYVLVRGRFRLAAGDLEGADADFAEAGALAEFVAASNPTLLPWRSWKAQCAHALGNTDEAQRLAAEELELARTFGAPRATARALRVAGRLAGGEDGIEMLEQAVQVLAPAPDRLERAHAQFALGAALRRAGRRAAAREQLAEALDVAHRCEAGTLMERSLQELRVAGARPRRPAMRGLASLTPSERRVTALAAEGMSNREIAESLFVTRRTVEMHLSNAYRKLEIASRGELNAALAETPPTGSAARA